MRTEKAPIYLGEEIRGLFGVDRHVKSNVLDSHHQCNSP